MWNDFMDDVLNNLRRFINRHRLMRPNGRYLVAVSGGADSVALLLMLKELGYHIEAAHCNFMLRGEESTRDEDFVCSLCARHGIPLHRVHFDTRTYARLHKVSIEMAARELRYAYFEQLRHDTGAYDVCVAHHQDDSVETILLNLLRGTGIHGLTGISPRQGHIVRPLLCVARRDLEVWLASRSQDYMTDSTNLVADVWRNKLRLNVVPQLLDITPMASHNILKTARLLAETAHVLDYATEDQLRQLEANGDDGQTKSIAIASLLELPSPLSLLFAWLKPCGFTSAIIDDIACQLPQARSGAYWQSSTHELCTHRGTLLLRELRPIPQSMTLPEPGNYIFGSQAKIRISLTERIVISRDPFSASLDASLIRFPLILRPARQGDRFVPLGMSEGSRLVSDFMTDRKLSLFQKRDQLLLTDAEGAILWVVGQRPDHRFRITPDTLQMLTANYLPTNH